MSEVENKNQTAEANPADSTGVKGIDRALADGVDTTEKSGQSPTGLTIPTNTFENNEDRPKANGGEAEAKEVSETSTDLASEKNNEAEQSDKISKSTPELASSDKKKGETKEDVLCKEVSHLTVENNEEGKESAEVAHESPSTQHSAGKDSQKHVPSNSSDNKENAASETDGLSAKDTSTSLVSAAGNKLPEEDTYSESDGQTTANKNTNNKEPIDSADDEYEEDEDEEEGVDYEDNDEDEADLDEDQIKSSPAYIPKHGNFYMHDVRSSNAAAAGPDAGNKHPEEGAEEEELAEGSLTKSTGEVGIRSRADRKWEHDLFDDRQQKPKTPKELERKYGKNIRHSEFKEGDELEEREIEPETPYKRRSNTSTTSTSQSGNRRPNLDGQSPRKLADVSKKHVERERRAPLPRDQPLRDNHRMTGSGGNRRMQSNREDSPILQTDRREAPCQQHRGPAHHKSHQFGGGGGRRTTFVSSTHRPPQNGGGAPSNRRPYNNQEEEERGVGYEYGRRQGGGDYRDEKFSPRNNQQQRYGRSNTERDYSNQQQQPTTRYQQEDHEGRNRGGGGRRYTSQRHATAPANGYNPQQGKKQQQQGVEDEWGRAGPQDWENDDWFSNSNKSKSNTSNQTMNSSSFTSVHNSQPPPAIRNNHQQPQATQGDYYPQSHQHNPNAQRFQPRYSQQQHPMRTDIPPPNYSQQPRRGRANYPTGPTAGPREDPYPHLRQPTDVVYFDAPQAGAPVALFHPATMGSVYHPQQQPTRERRRLNIAPPTQQQFSN